MSNSITLPGLIDCHVHFREPGFEQKEDMESGAAAAHAGGVRTVCDMPNTNPATVSIAALEDKIKRAQRIGNVDIRFFFGATKSEHVAEFKKAWAIPELRKRLVGLKIFFDHSTGDQGANIAVIEEAFKVCAEIGAPIVGHCEDAMINAEAKKIISEQMPDTEDVSLHSLMRPCASEVTAVKQAIALVREHGTQFHIAHISSAQGVELVRQVKKEGLPITCEVTPHHLFLNIHDYSNLGSKGKMNPPLRSIDEQQALWIGISDGTIDCISTDHAPHLLAEKEEGNPLNAPSGVPGVETMLSLLLTVAAGGWPHPESEKPDINFSYEYIAKLCFDNPNKIFSLNKRREDFIKIDPENAWIIQGKDLHSKCKWTPYEGWKVRGKIM